MGEFFKMYNNSSAAGTSRDDTEGDSIGTMRGWQQHDIVEIGTGWDPMGVHVCRDFVNRSLLACSNYISR